MWIGWWNGIRFEGGGGEIGEALFRHHLHWQREYPYLLLKQQRWYLQKAELASEHFVLFQLADAYLVTV